MGKTSGSGWQTHSGWRCCRTDVACRAPRAMASFRNGEALSGSGSFPYAEAFLRSSTEFAGSASFPGPRHPGEILSRAGRAARPEGSFTSAGLAGRGAGAAQAQDGRGGRAELPDWPRAQCCSFSTRSRSVGSDRPRPEHCAPPSASRHYSSSNSSAASLPRPRWWIGRHDQRSLNARAARSGWPAGERAQAAPAEQASQT